MLISSHSTQGPVPGAKKHPLEDQAEAYDRSMGVVGNRGPGGARGRSQWKTKVSRK
jgi:hypothetical protein